MISLAISTHTRFICLSVRNKLKIYKTLNMYKIYEIKLIAYNFIPQNKNT